MNFLSMMNTRWPAEEIKKWSSIRKTAYILMPLLIYLVVHDLAEYLLWAIMELIVTNSGEVIVKFIEKNSCTIQGALNGLSVVCGVAAIWVAAKAEITANSSTNSSTNNRKASDYILLSLLAASTSIGFNILLALLGITTDSDAYSGIVKQQYGVYFWVGLILYGIFYPFAEETVFRGLIYNRMKRSFGYVASILISSALFGLYHGNLVQEIYGTILGLFIAYTYEKYNDFKAPVLFHSVANICIYSLTYSNSFHDIAPNVAAFMAAGFLLFSVFALWIIKRKRCE